VLTYLLNQKSVDVNINGEGGFTLLHVACQYINRLPIDVFKLLIEKMGCNVNAWNFYKDTPIHLALNWFYSHEGGDVTILTYLLNQKNVNVNIMGQSGST
jgi:hypothetical protein